MNWTRCKSLHHECMLISGIYEIVSLVPGEYHAFYIRDGYKHWGDYVAKPPDRGDNNRTCWLSLEDAKQACENHSKSHTPKPATVRRAAELLAEMEVIE